MATRLPLTLVLVVLVALLLGGVGGYLLGMGRAPGNNSADVGFARDMSLHHEQAVQMATVLYERGTDPAVRALAYDILTTQQGQMGIMSGWLDAWNVAQTSTGPRMTWMGMSVEGGMPGMATPEQMAELRAAEGDAADVLFLQLMIDHHAGGVAMAEEAARLATQQPVRQLATSMVESQASEIAYMQSLLAARGIEPPSGNLDEQAEDGHDHTDP